MDKRKLSRVPRESASADMMDMSGQLGEMTHIVTARLIEDKKILLLTFYRISELQKGKPEAEFRTFLSDSDYITQDLNTSKVKWLTAAFANMWNFSFLDYEWDNLKMKSTYRENVFIMTEDEKCIINDFFKAYQNPNDKYGPWTRIHRFQEDVKAKRLAVKHKKVTDKIDEVMDPIKEAPKSFIDWVWEKGMSFSRYLIYKEETKGKAVCECTHCGEIGVVDRKNMRLRNNEKGICPFCGSRVTIKARGRMPAQILEERWFLYVDSTQEGFVLRYFNAYRCIRNDSYIDMLINKDRVEQSIYEYGREIYTFPNGEPKYVSYNWGVYKQRGMPRWCPGRGNVSSLNCILFPGNLPQAWAHTPMRYSALELLPVNMPTVTLRYEDAIKKYLNFPKLEWICKMGLNNLAKDIINARYHGDMVGKINYKGRTIYEILGLTKINTKVLQEIDGNHNVLRLLQVSQEIGLQFKPEQLKEYYETFECNTDLLSQSNRKVSLHKLVRYVEKESENYPLGERDGWRQYSYIRHEEREDPRIERKRNMAKDWLEYLKWCKELKYDLDNMFFYMPKNFKKVHDRTAKEYQELQDKKAAAEKRRREALAKKNMEDMKKAMEKIFKKSDGIDAFYIKGKRLILVVPKDASDIKHEGEVLHHCVGGYVERVAKGETNIFFVRKVNEPDTPYFTMEYWDNMVIQCRGAHNCEMPPEVKAFVNAFEKKMQDAALNQGKKKHRKAG